MIQRIQTVYLLIVFALTFSMFFTKTVTIEYRMADSRVVQDDGSITTTHHFADDSVTINLVKIQYSNRSEMLWFSFILLIITTIVPLFNIFLYHHRTTQLKFCFVEGILLMGLIAFEVLYVNNVTSVISDIPKTTDFGVSVVFPFICLVLIFLAGKAIIKDEALVASYERLR